jgi:hypothetical protein
MSGMVGDSRYLERMSAGSLVREGDTELIGLAELRDKNCSRARIIARWCAVWVKELGR